MFVCFGLLNVGGFPQRPGAPGLSIDTQSEAFRNCKFYARAGLADWLLGLPWDYRATSGLFSLALPKYLCHQALPLYGSGFQRLWSLAAGALGLGRRREVGFELLSGSVYRLLLTPLPQSSTA